jgi:hypothetical protein
MANMKLINECNMFLNSIHNAELEKRTIDARMLKLGLRAYVTLTGEGSDNPDVVEMLKSITPFYKRPHQARNEVKAHAE